MSKEHTSTPWKQSGTDVLDERGTQIATTAFAGYHANVSDEDNAAHIVKCVNMHDELVEALKIASGYRMTADDYLIVMETLQKAGAL